MCFDSFVTSYAVVRCRYTLVGDSMPGSAPVDARWHPLSDQHFVVLHERAIRIYDTATSYAVPIDEWVLPSLPSKPIACNFGSLHNWDAFALYILLSDGSIYFITPIVPFGAVVPRPMWQALHDSMKAVRELPATQVDDAMYESAGISLSWLDDAFVDVEGDDQWRRYLPRDSGRFGRSRNGADVRVSTLAPCLQGPIRTVPSLPGRDACDIICLEHKSAPALAVLYWDGRVASIVGTNPIAPSWSRAVSTSSGIHPQIVPVGTPLDAFLSKDAGLKESSPYAVVAAVDLMLQKPLERAKKSLDNSGATYPGGATG